MLCKVEIRHQKTGSSVFSGEYKSFKEAVEDAARQGISLSYASLSTLCLSHANLSGVDFSYANLYCVGFSFANLSHADMSGADLSYANCSCADLSKTSLHNARLHCVNFSNTVLDPNNKPNGICNEFEEDSEDPSLVIGYRSRNSVYMNPTFMYVVGRTYKAEVFSTCPITECHPGLYLCPGLSQAGDMIRVWSRKVDIHKVEDKYRTREFVRVGEI